MTDGVTLDVPVVLATLPVVLDRIQQELGPAVRGEQIYRGREALRADDRGQAAS